MNMHKFTLLLTLLHLFITIDGQTTPAKPTSPVRPRNVQPGYDDIPGKVFKEWKVKL